MKQKPKNFKDKNGKRIYEGAIIHYMSDMTGETKVGLHEVVWDDTRRAFGIKSITTGKILIGIYGTLSEVVGDVDKNPDLLK